MKVFLISVFLFGASYADLLCDDYYGCNEKHILSEEAIAVLDPMPHFTIYKSSGSISKHTLSNLNHVEALYIEASNITHIEEGALCSLPRLTKLQITYNPTMPKLTKQLLGDCFRLTFLSISGHTIEDDALGNMANLESISLVDTNVPQSLCFSSHLTSITIEKIKDLNLTRNHLKYCSKLKELNIANIDGIYDDAFDTLRSLKYLDLYKINMPAITAYHFMALTNLKYLALEDCKIQRIADGAFDSLRNLKYLSITFADVMVYWIHLQFLGNLEDLVLKQTTQVDTLHSLSQSFLPSLRTLTVEVEDLSFVDVRSIKWSLPKLEQLIFYGSSNVCYNQRLVQALQSQKSRSFEIKFEDGPATDGFC